MSILSAGRREVRDRIGPERIGRLNLARSLLAAHQHILLVSHMRSYSTLLGHLFGSHPEVSGYAEQHRSYRSSDDLAGLCFGVWRISDHVVARRYLFDKLLHDKYVIHDRVLHRRDVLPIYAVREPVASLRSIVVAGRLKGRDRWSSPEPASAHLFKRYTAVRELCARRPDAAALFTDSVVTDPDATLAALADHVGLSSPIRPEYDRFPKTGVAGFGDPVGPIAAGRILQDRPEHPVEVPESLAARLVEDYRHTCEVLTASCSTVVGQPVLSSP